MACVWVAQRTCLAAVEFTAAEMLLVHAYKQCNVYMHSSVQDKLCLFVTARSKLSRQM